MDLKNWTESYGLDLEKYARTSGVNLDVRGGRPIEQVLDPAYRTTLVNNLSNIRKEFEKNTNLMLDGFTFSVAIPGHLRNTNATFISENDNTIYWEFDFNDIATSHFNMYAHSIVINNLSIQLFLLIILLVFIGFLWKKRSKKE